RAPATLYWRQIRDGIAQRDLAGVLGGPLEWRAVAHSDEYQSLPELWNPVTPSLYNSLLHRIAEPLELEHHAAQDEHLPIQCHVRHVLHHHGPRPGQANDLQEGSP